MLKAFGRLGVLKPFENEVCFEVGFIYADLFFYLRFKAPFINLALTLFLIPTGHKKKLEPCELQLFTFVR